MKNGDKPAMPAIHSIDGNWVKEPLEQFRGITKREYFAAMAMQGLLSGIDKRGEYSTAIIAIDMADELLKHLGDK